MMIKPIHRILLALSLASAGASALAADVGVSVNISQPGLYGRVDIGRVPTPPVLVYPQPMVIVPGPVVHREPIYLHVPPGHAKNWRRYCGRYSACGQPVYFVRDDWYRNHYYRPAPPPRGDGHRRDDWHDPGHGRGRDHDHDRGHGHGHGHGHGR